MRFAEAWRVALDALRVNRLRSGLTMLGVVIGVAAVVVLVAIGTGAKQEVESQVQGLGSNLLLVVPGKVSFGNAPTVSPMSMADVEAVSRVAGGRDRLTATLSSGETVRAGVNSKFTSVLGILETTPTVFTRALAQGSYVSRSDVDTGRRVAVLGYAVAQKLFGDRDAVPGGRGVREAGAEPRRGPRRRGTHPDHGNAAAARHVAGGRARDQRGRPRPDRRAQYPGGWRADPPASRYRVQRRHPGPDPRRARQGTRRADRGTGRDHLVGHRARVRRLGRRGHRLRRGTGAAGRPAGSGDRAPDRVRVRTSTAVTSWTLTFTL